MPDARPDEPEEAEELDPDAEQEEAPDPSGQDGGWWLTCEPKDAKKGVLQAIKEQQVYRRYRRAYEAVCERTRAGERGLSVQPRGRGADLDYSVRGDITGVGMVAPSANIADQLLNRTAAVLTVDPLVAEINGNSDDPKEREASALGQRLLRVEGSPLKRDDTGFQSDSINLAGTYGSVFSYFCVNPQGAGLKPVQIQAHRTSKTTEDALTPIDPTTGLPLQGISDADLIWRYVTVDGRLTDIQAEAKMAWRSNIDRRLLRPSNITLLPFGANAYNATGVIVGELLPLSEVVSRFYDGERPSEDICKKLCTWKPNEVETSFFVPRTIRENLPQTPPMRPTDTGTPEIADYALVPLLSMYMTSHGGAPLGAYIVVGGPDEPIYREPYRWTIGEGDEARIEYPDLPIAQLVWLESEDGDPMGTPGIQALMANSDLNAALTQCLLEWMWRVGNPHTYVPVGTVVQDEAFMARTGGPIVLGPGNQAPFIEQAENMPAQFFEQITITRDNLQKDAGLSTTVASGAQDGNINSGLQQRLASEEARTALSNLAKNSDRYFITNCSLLLKHKRAFTPTPEILEYTGEAGDVERESFMGVDLEGAGDIQIAKGSGTMLSPSAKTEMARSELDLAMNLQKAGIPGAEEAVEKWHKQIVSNQGPLVGIQDDPHNARMLRQRQQWEKGAKQMNLPPAPPAIPPDPMASPQMGPDGQPIPPQPQAAPDPVADQAMAIFKPNPTDEMPTVAPMRYRQLSEMLASKAFEAADPRYQQAAYLEFERMRKAAGVQTKAEFDAAQQQAAQMAQQAEQMKQQGEIEKIDAKKSHDPLPGVPGKAPEAQARAPMAQPQGLPA